MLIKLQRCPLCLIQLDILKHRGRGSCDVLSGLGSCGSVQADGLKFVSGPPPLPQINENYPGSHVYIRKGYQPKGSLPCGDKFLVDLDVGVTTKTTSQVEMNHKPWQAKVGGTSP